MTPFERLLNIRMGGSVERCHTVKHRGSYSNAAHSWGVATIMYVLWPEDFPRLASYCIFHDVPEAWVGDVPAPPKFYDSDIKAVFDRLERRVFHRLNLPNDADLNDLDRAKLKACDSLELYFWAKEELASGNMHARTVLAALEGFYKRQPLLPEAQELLSNLRSSDCVHNLRDGDGFLYGGT